MSERMGYDAPKHTRDEATELCVYHLRMAASLFQLVPDDGNKALQEEIKRQCSDDEYCDLPAQVWADKIFDMYEQAKDRD
jgi:hypothetical protein